MKPDVNVILDVVAGKLLVEIAPAVQPSYRRSSVALTGLLLGMVREEWDRSAARRVEENVALRTLFSRATKVVTDTGLRNRLQNASSAGDSNLLISELENSNSALRSLLIELHAHVESLDSPGARPLDDEIWRELVASTERRRFALSPF